VDELVVGKSGPKLKESVEGTPPEAKEGFPSLPAGRSGMSANFGSGRGRLATRQEPVSVLAGLKLEDRKAPFDVVVVDHAEKVPTRIDRFTPGA
jgi:hypothetical protein